MPGEVNGAERWLGQIEGEVATARDAANSARIGLEVHFDPDTTNYLAVALVHEELVAVCEKLNRLRDGSGTGTLAGLAHVISETRLDR